MHSFNERSNFIATNALKMILMCFCFTPIFCNNDLRIDLGEVSLSEFPECDHEINHYRNKCEKQYHHLVQETLRRHAMDARTESVRRVKCCGIWHARDCVAEAALRVPSCGKHVALRFKNLPNDPTIKKDVADECSEYDESAPICVDTSFMFASIFNNTSIVFASIWNILALVIFKIIINL